MSSFNVISFIFLLILFNECIVGISLTIIYFIASLCNGIKFDDKTFPNILSINITLHISTSGTSSHDSKMLSILNAKLSNVSKDAVIVVSYIVRFSILSEKICIRYPIKSIDV